MPTTQLPGKPTAAATAPATPVASASGARLPGPHPISPQALAAARKRRQFVQLAVGGGVVLVLALGITLLAWRPWRPAPPRLDVEPFVVGKFASTSAFDDLTFDQKYQYMHLLDSKEEALKAAYTGGKLTDAEYR